MTCRSDLAMLPNEWRDWLETTVTRLAGLPGIEAVVLGGSWAEGTAREGSDLDLALYYREASPFSIQAIRELAADCSLDGAPTVTDFHGWGPWVNGGAWIQTSLGKVDFLYRNLDQVQRTLTDAKAGRHEHHFLQQPANGFFSVIYLAETRIAIPLHDPHARLEALKQQIAAYPPLLKANLIKDYLWMAEFSLVHARKFAQGGDIYATAGCAARIASFLVQVLYAANESYFLGDKRALERLRTFERVPENFEGRVGEILGHCGRTTEELTASIQALTGLWKETCRLKGSPSEGEWP